MSSGANPPVSKRSPVCDGLYYRCQESSRLLFSVVPFATIFFSTPKKAQQRRLQSVRESVHTTPRVSPNLCRVPALCGPRARHQRSNRPVLPHGLCGSWRKVGAGHKAHTGLQQRVRGTVRHVKVPGLGSAMTGCVCDITLVPCGEGLGGTWKGRTLLKWRE